MLKLEACPSETSVSAWKTIRQHSSGECDLRVVGQRCLGSQITPSRYPWGCGMCTLFPNLGRTRQCICGWWTELPGLQHRSKALSNKLPPILGQNSRAQLKMKHHLNEALWNRACDLCSWGARFESHPGHLISLLEFTQSLQPNSGTLISSQATITSSFHAILTYWR